MPLLASRRSAFAAAALGFAALLLLAHTRSAGAAALEVVRSDARGVTLQFTLPDHKVSSVDRPEGTF